MFAWKNSVLLNASSNARSVTRAAAPLPPPSDRARALENRDPNRVNRRQDQRKDANRQHQFEDRETDLRERNRRKTPASSHPSNPVIAWNSAKKTWLKP